MSQVTVISGVERRRIWTDEQKRALVAAVCEPGASVAEIARRADLRASQLYRWRRDLAGPAVPGFAVLTVSGEPEQAVASAAVVLEVGGAVLRIAADAPPALVMAVVRSQVQSPAIERAPVSVTDPTPPDKSRYTLFDPTPQQFMRAFSTDRPDTTESPYTVDAGHFQIELSLADYAYDKDAGVRTRTLGVLPANLKVGLLNNVDVQFVFTPYERVETRTGGTRAIASGFSDDTQVRLKVNLWGNDGGSTAFAIMPFVKVPTGARALSNDHVEGGVILPLAIGLPSDFSLGTMAEFDLVYDDGRRDYGVDFVHSATLGHPIAGLLAGYIEYVGVVPREGGGRYRAIASAGLTYPLAKNWIVDGGGTLGLAGAVDDATVFIGTSLRF